MNQGIKSKWDVMGSHFYADIVTHCITFKETILDIIGKGSHRQRKNFANLKISRL